MSERRENIARALWAVTHQPSAWDWPVNDGQRAYYRTLADAAIAADDLQARMLALADELDDWRNVPVHADRVAVRIRAAVDPA